MTHELTLETAEPDSPDSGIAAHPHLRIASNGAGIDLEAAQRADQAYEAGEMANFRLWTQISRAVERLLQTRPDGTPLN